MTSDLWRNTDIYHRYEQAIKRNLSGSIWKDAAAFAGSIQGDSEQTFPQTPDDGEMLAMLHLVSNGDVRRFFTQFDSRLNDHAG